jgi:hypothetical protein
VGTVGADNAGNIYTFGGGGASSELSKLAVGGSAPLASYAPTSSQPLTMSVAPGGEMVVLGISGNDAVFDEWDPGKTGAPSRTITYAETNGIEATFAQDADGNLYVPYTTSSGAQKFDVLRADSSSLLRTLTESLAERHGGRHGRHALRRRMDLLQQRSQCCDVRLLSERRGSESREHGARHRRYRLRFRRQRVRRKRQHGLQR